MALSETQLTEAFNDVFFLAQQQFAYYLWATRIQPDCASISPVYETIVRNAVVESQLMAYRKLHEFFLAPRYPDDLRSSIFGYPSSSGFLNEDEVRALHKRVAHPTTLKATNGNVAFRVYDFSHAALEHVLPFIEQVGRELYPNAVAERDAVLDGVRLFREWWNEWTDAVPENERKKLKA